MNTEIAHDLIYERRRYFNVLKVGNAEAYKITNKILFTVDNKPNDDQGKIVNAVIAPDNSMFLIDARIRSFRV